MNKIKQENNLVDKRKGKKTLAAFMVLGLSCIMLFGSLFAFFSDQLTGSGSTNAGTLDISANTDGGNGYTIKRWDVTSSAWVDYNFGADILNPGDYLLVSIDVKNEGSKSAWLRGEFEFDFGVDGNTKTDLQDSMVFYKGKVEYGLTGTVLTLDEAGLKSTYTSTPVILNGSTETETGAVGTSYTADVMTIVFKETAGNAAQALPVQIDVAVKALQYRNNLNPNSSSWASVTELN